MSKIKFFKTKEFTAKEKLEIVNVRRSRSEFIHLHQASRAKHGEQTPFELPLRYTVFEN